VREFNDNFLAASNQSTKRPLYTIEIATDTAFTALEYFTSSPDAQHPGGASVIDSVVENFSGTSQRIDPIKFVASIGAINFELVDKGRAVTALFNTILDGGDGLREKRVRIYMGFEGLAWADYEISQTQIITGVVYDGGVYKISCADIQRIEKKDIFDLAKTNIQSTVELPPESSLTSAINNSVTTIAIGDASDFASSGAILIGSEIITYTIKGATNILDCTRGTNNTTAAAHNDNTTVYQTMYTVTVYDTSDFELNEHDAEYTDEPDQTVGYFKMGDEVFRYDSKTGTTFINCFRGALNTKPAEHKVDTTKSRYKRPEVEEYVYIETNAVKVIYGLLLGAWYNNPTFVNLPSNWHLNIDTIWIRNSDFTDIGDDFWNNTVTNINSGFKVRFEGVKKQDGKRFIEKEILPLIGCYPPVYAEGDIGLKRSTGVLSDAAYVIELNASNINQNSSLALNFNQKAVANKFKLKWNWSPVTEDYSRPFTFVDATSIGIHQDAAAIELNFRGLYGNIHTEATVKRIVQRLRDRYAAPPIEMTLSVLPSLHGLEVGDIVRVNYDKIRDYTSDSEVLDRSYEIQQKSVNWITGNVTLKLFGSTAQAGIEVLSDSTKVLYNNDTTLNGAINNSVTTITLTDASDFPSSGAVEVDSESITYTGKSSNDLTGCNRGAHGTTAASHTDTTNVHNSYYTDQGGINIKSLSSYSSNSINSESLTGMTLLADAVYYHTAGLTINTGTTIDWSNNASLLVEGHIAVNGAFDLSGGGKFGASAGNLLNGQVGKLSSLPSGGGILALINYSTASTVYAPYAPHYGFSTEGDRDGRSGLHPGELNYNGTDIIGLPTNLMGSGGRSGGSTIIKRDRPHGLFTNTANGGAGGDGGSGFLIICQGMSFGVNGSINTSGEDGSLGTTTTLPGTSEPDIYSGAGAGGAPGGVYIVIEGSGSTIPGLSSKLTANYGACPVQSNAVLLNAARSSVPDNSLSKYISNGDNTKSGYKSASRIQFLTDYVDEGADDNEWVPSGPTGLTAASGTTELMTLGDGTVVSRIKLTWTASTDQNIDHYEIGYIGPDGLRLSEEKPSRDVTTAYLYPVVDGAEYYCFVTPINVFGRVGNALYVFETVTGKSAAPSDPTAFTSSSVIGGIEISLTSGQMPTDKDLKSIIIYTGTTNNVASATDTFSVAAAHSQKLKYRYDATAGQTRYHWISFLDTTGNESGTYPGDTSGQAATAGYASGTDVQYSDSTPLDDLQPGESGGYNRGVFNETFELGNTDKWTIYEGAGTYTFPSNGVNGGKVANIDSHSWKYLDKNISFDPSSLYRIRCKVRLTTASADPAKDHFWCGIEGYAQNGTTLLNQAGADSHESQFYICANAKDMSGFSLNSWQEFTGYFKGHGTFIGNASDPENPSGLYAGIAYFRPLFIVSYNGGDGVMEIDYISIDIMPEDADQIPESATQKWAGESGADVTQTAVESGIDAVSSPVIMRGVDAYSNDAVYWHTYFDSIDGFNKVMGGGELGVEGIYISANELRVQVDTAGSEDIEISKSLNYTITDLTWSNNRRFKMQASTPSNFYTRTVFIGIGAKDNRRVGVTSDSSNTNIWGSCHNGTSESRIDLGVGWSAIGSGGGLLEAEFLAGDRVKFYVNGSYMTGKDLTTNLPTGTLSADKVMDIYMNNDGSTQTSAAQIKTSEFKFYQDN